MKANVTYIVSDIDKAIAFEWIVERINKDKISLAFILKNNQSSYLFKYFKQKNISVYTVSCKCKKGVPLTIFKCGIILKKIKLNTVHCHLFIVNIIGLISVKIIDVKSRIYTMRPATFHHIYYPHVVKLYKYGNTLATEIVSISDNVAKVLIDIVGKMSNKLELNKYSY